MRAIALLFVAACTHDITVFDRVAVQPTARDLDILYVFDDSPDRGSYDIMAAQLDVLQQRLKEMDDRLPSLHVGVVTTDLGTRGRLDTQPGIPIGNCTGSGGAGRLVTFEAGVTGAYLEDLRGPNNTRQRNFDSNDLGFELARLTNPRAGLADGGCEIEQPLEAMRRALEPGANPGFLRPGALLSVVFVTTDDDCSLARGSLLDPLDASLGPLGFRCVEQGVVCDGADPRSPGVRTNCRPRDGSPYLIDVSEYRTFLQQLKPDPRDVVVSAVAGAPTPFEVVDAGGPSVAPSCQGPGGSARPAVRVGALVDSFGGVMIDGCTQDTAYQRIAAPIVDRQRSCFPNLRRSDGEDCSVVEVVSDTATELARCAAGDAGPCWYTYADAAACPAGDNLGIAVRRGSTPAPEGSRIDATCFAK